MKITIITPLVSNNCLGRAYILAQMLQKYFDTEIVGFSMGGIWEPLKEVEDIKIKSVPLDRKHLWRSIKQLMEMIEGDVIYASKLYLVSFGVAILQSLKTSRPLVLDIDDLDILDIMGDASWLKRLYIYLDPRRLQNPFSPIYTLLMEKLRYLADAITVSSRFLQKKYGGTIIPHARDTDWLNPSKYPPEKAKKKYGLEGKKVVMFYGTPRPHKGVEDMLDAVCQIEDPSVIGVVGGVNKKDPYCRYLMEKYKEKAVFFPVQPFSTLPEFVSMADVVVIPQRKTLYAMAQVPAKVFDAMAMAKPVIATNVSDLPHILEGCGIIVPPECPEEIKNALIKIFGDKTFVRKMGIRARRKCIENYSYQVCRKKLKEIMEKVLYK